VFWSPPNVSATIGAFDPDTANVMTMFASSSEPAAEFNADSALSILLKTESSCLVKSRIDTASAYDERLHPSAQLVHTFEFE